MAEFQQSELLRVPLEDIALQVALLLQHSEIDIHTFLSQAMDPPHPLTINNAISLLQSLQCLDEKEHVTLLGKLISDIPVSPCLGRMLVYSYLFHKTDDALKLACAMSYKDPFIIPSEHQRAALAEVKLRYTQHPSDHMVLVNLMNKYIDEKKHMSFGKLMQFCDEHFISHITMNFIVELYQRIRSTLAPFHVQIDSSRFDMLMPLTTIGLYPDYSVRKQTVKVYSTEKGRKAKIHPSSINHQVCSGICTKSFELIGYQDMVSTVNSNPGGASLLMLPTSSVCILTMLLTCGTVELLNNETEDVERVEILVDKWLKISVYESFYNIILVLRRRLIKTLNQCLKSHPTNKVNNDLLQVLGTVMSMESNSMRIKREGGSRYANKKEMMTKSGGGKSDLRGKKGGKNNR